MTELKPGDVVVLLSGGPRMTVASLQYVGSALKTVQCDWFEGNKLNRDDFTPESLKLASESDS